jgi:hypothetical protein
VFRSVDCVAPTRIAALDPETKRRIAELIAAAASGATELSPQTAEAVKKHRKTA